MKTGYVATILFVLSGAYAKTSHFDPPDLNLEQKLHQSYLIKSGFSALPKSGLSETYRLQKGETLWSLSDLLYGDGHYWPRVWAQNRGITNPNLIRKGHTLQLLLGTEDETPAFRFSEDGDSGLELTAAPGQNPLVEIPPPEVPPRPIIKVPASFPEWQSVYGAQPEELVDYRQLGQTQGEFANKLFLHAYVQEQPVEPLGAFLELDSEAGVPVTNQYVYVKILKGSGRVGQKYLIVRDQGLIMGSREARLVQIFGEIEITETATPSFKAYKDRENFDVFRALVTNSIALITKDTVLVSGKLELVDTSDNGTPGNVTASIIGSANHKATSVMGPGELVFLNRGSRNGLRPGHLLNVFVNRVSRHANTPVAFSPASSGVVKVLKVSEAYATAIVLKARDSIQRGDEVRQAVKSAEAEKLVVPQIPRRVMVEEKPTSIKEPTEDLESEVEEELEESDEF